jgi:hypothetical protein
VRHRARGALILLGLLGVWACTAPPEREPAGEAPPFHDQILADDSDISFAPALFVDVRRDAILVGPSNASKLLIFPRDGATTFEQAAVRLPLRVPGDDRFLVWSEQTRAGRWVFAASSEQPEQSWRVLEYPFSNPWEGVVVGDRVAVVTDDAIIHAPIVGGPPEELALDLHPYGLPSSDNDRLVWLAKSEYATFVMSTDASFTSVTLEHTVPDLGRDLVRAVPLGDGLVFAIREHLGGTDYDAVLKRKRSDGSVIELVRTEDPWPFQELVGDGTQAWFHANNRLWWIGVDSHGQIPSFAAEVESMAADDGLLLWRSGDVLHVAGQRFSGGND